MKGVMKIVDPELEIVDLTHDIKKFDPWEASLSLAATEPYWPMGTIIVSVVDPGVGTDRKACAAKLNDGTIVITPDNGTLTHLLHSPGIREVREIDESVNRYRGGDHSEVFHGRDLFGYCAAKLASGLISFEEVGPQYPIVEIVECEEFYARPVLTEGFAEGFVLTGVRHYGSISLNITAEAFAACGFAIGEMVRVLIRHDGKGVFAQSVRYCKAFGDVEKGQPLLYDGSSGWLCLDINQGSFMEAYGVETGKDWIVTIRREDNES
jgi:S-adenosylmethionine hydrolase